MLAELWADRTVRVIGGVLVILVTMGLTAMITAKRTPDARNSDAPACRMAEHALEDAYSRMRRICNGNSFGRWD